MEAPAVPRRRNTFFEITLIDEVSLESWRLLFDATEYPNGLGSKSLKADKVAEALTNEPLQEDILTALLTNLELGTPEGVDAIRAEAQAQLMDVSGWPDDEGPRDLVMRLWVDARSDVTLADLLDRAQMSVHASSQRTVREFTGKEPGPPRTADMKVLRSRLRDPIATACENQGMSDYCEVRGCVRESEFCFEVIHGYRMQKPAVIQDKKRTVIRLRPAHCDSLRYDAQTGRLRIAARAAAMLPIYREALGVVLFGDAQFFKGDRTCMLEPLQVRGQAALDDHNMGQRIARARLVEFTWERGEATRWSLRDKNCFTEVHRLGLALSEGDLVHAKIELMLIGADKSRNGRRVVTITPPNRIHVPDELVKSEVEDYLDQIGVRSRSLTTPELDLWSLAPWLHHETKWMAMYGDGMNWLRRDKLLVPAQLERVTHPDYPNHVGALRVEVMQRGGKKSFHGVSEDADVPPRPLTSSEVSGLRLDESRLVKSVAEGLKVSGPAPREAIPGVWDLGSRSIGDAKIHVFMATRKPATQDAAARETLTRRARQAQSVLLVPVGRDAGLGIPQAEWAFPSVSYDRLLPVIVDALELGADVPAVFYAPADARLVVDPTFKQAWLDGVPLGSLKPDTQPFVFTTLLAEAKGRPVETKALDKKIAGRDGAAREARADAIKAMRESFAEASKPEPADLGTIFRNTKGSYSVTIPAFVPAVVP